MRKEPTKEETEKHEEIMEKELTEKQKVATKKLEVVMKESGKSFTEYEEFCEAII